MKQKILYIITILTCVISSYSQPQVKTIVNDENAVKRNVAAFTGIQVSNAITVYLSQGNEDAVAISCSDANKTDKIITEVKNGILKINLEEGFWNRMSLNNLKVKAYVSIKNIESLKISGASSIKINEGINCLNLNIEISGASSLKGNIKANSIKIDASGASSLNIVGSANTTDIKLSGASNFKNYDFIVENCKMEASGASSINISVSGDLKAEANGASSIKYGGNPKTINTEVNGASSIKKKVE